MRNDSSTTPTFIPVVVTDAAMMQQIGRLRVKAWKADGELPLIAKDDDIWLDEHDDHAMNWAIVQNGRPIAAARACMHARFGELPDLLCLTGYEHCFQEPVTSFNRMVVDPDFRRMGLSKILDEARVKWAQSNGSSSIVVSSHLDHRVHTLERTGFTNLGLAKESAIWWASSSIFMRRVGGGNGSISVGD